MTAAYMSRMYFQLFFGEKVQAKFIESGLIKVTLSILSVLSLWFVFAWNPLNPNANWLTNWLVPVSDQSIPHRGFITILSIGLALIGLFISYLYVARQSLQVPIEKVKSMFYQLSKHHFYLDFFYSKVLTRGLMKWAEFVYFFDKKILDRFIDYLAMAEVIFANIIGWFDRAVVDGLVNLMARTARFFGNRARNIQSGSVQMYFVWAIVGILAIFYFLN